MAKSITLLGSTGSIGTQSLDVARSQGYEVSVYNIPPVENPREGASASSQTESSSESQTESQSESGTEAE